VGLAEGVFNSRARRSTGGVRPASGKRIAELFEGNSKGREEYPYGQSSIPGGEEGLEQIYCQGSKKVL